MYHHHHQINGDEHEENEENSDTDSSESLDSISSAEIETHFAVRHGRVFHSLGNDTLTYPYPLPVDDIEQERATNLHRLIKRLMGGLNYFGPVIPTLASEATRRRLRALDICTGNGNWVDEMAAAFPRVKFYGIDIVPLATRFPAENVQYEVHDANEPMRWADGRFDLVNMRNVQLSLRDYPQTLREVARILRPGGLFLSGEWMLGLYMPNGAVTTTNSAPNATRFLQYFLFHMSQRGINTAASRVHQMLQENGSFVEITAHQRNVRLDSPDSISASAKQAVLDFSDSIRGFFLDSQFQPQQVEGLIQGLREDVENIPGLTVVYHAVYAFKRN